MDATHTARPKNDRAIRGRGARVLAGFGTAVAGAAQHPAHTGGCRMNDASPPYPISEQYRELAEQWSDLDAAAHIDEELKSTLLEQKKTALIKLNPGLAENKAERVVKSSPE